MNAHPNLPKNLDELLDELASITARSKGIEAVAQRAVEGRVKDDRPRKSDRFPSGRAA